MTYDLPAFNSKPFKIIMKVNTGTINTNRYICKIGTTAYYSVLIINSDNNLTFWNHVNDGNDTDITPILLNIPANTELFLKVEWDGNYYWVSKSNDGKNWTDGTKKASTYPPKTYNQNGIIIGYLGIDAGAYGSGSIDLKQFSITVDGVEVFNGNKTGIDQIKKDDYTVVGSPTITDGGIASGFSSDNYIDILSIDVTNKDFEIDLGKQLTSSSFVQSSYMISGQNSIQNLFSIGIRDGKIFAGSNSHYFNGILPNYPLQTDTYYWIKGGAKNNSAYLMISTNGIDYTTYTNTLTSAYTSLSLRIGYSGDNIPQLAYNGSIDLNSFKIYVDGNLVYQPTLKIPYNQSKTGSKIVNAIYRDRVQDMYEQFGWANYYTLSDTDFTVPMGENLDGHVTIVDWYKNGVTSWEYDTNLDCTQTGSCTSGTAVTLPKPFKDTNYALSVPYSAKTATGFTPSASGEYIAKGKVVLG
ncbi:MAG: hypothetical protein MJ180_00160 [Candidatus Gastranaerophilales bacterium]|nr:hypothetical protein [Candidatus Gastranaerophilales bacterium]